MTRSPRSAVALCLFALTFAACQPELAVPVQSKHLIGFTLEAPANRAPTDSALQLKTFGYLSDGSRVDLTTVTEWTSSEPSIGRVSSSGVVSLIGVGTTRVEGRFEDRLVVLAIEATAARLESLELSASADGLLPLGDSRRFEAIGVYSDGQRLDVTARATWRTDDAQYAQLGSTPGTIVARREGLATVAALFGGREAAMNVGITRARMTGLRVQSYGGSLKLGELRQLRAFASFSDGSERDVTAEAQWSSSEGAITLHAQAGMILASAIGHSMLTVEFGGMASTLTLAVHEKAMLSIEVERTTLTLAKGIHAPIRVFARFDDASVEQLVDEVSWSSSDPAVAIVGQGGVIEAHSEGVTTLTASLEGFESSLDLTVGAPVVVRLAPTFAGGRMLVNQATTMKVFGVLSDGATVNLSTTVRFTHGAQLFADVMGDRLELRALSPGQAPLALEFGAFTQQVPIEITSETVTNISLQHMVPSVRPDTSSSRFRAIATWSDGAVTDVSELGSWWIDDAAVVELHDDPGRRGFFTVGQGGKAELHFEHPEQAVQLTWDFDR